ncbi:TPA: hypothetical protein ACH3X1_011194 [Trebouxia sp. C0004]
MSGVGSCSILNAELWDVTQALERQQTGDASTHADPVLFMAQGTIPDVLPPLSPASSPDWTFTPYNQVANDYFGYQLMRPYQRIRQTHNPKCAAPCTAPWYIQILNSQLWSSFNLTYQLRVTCQSATDQQGCPSPALSEAAPHLPKQQCSDNGSCQIFDPVCTDATFAQGECTFCECDAGWGDVGCNIPTPDLAFDTEQLYSTQSGAWSFFNVALDSWPLGGTLLLELNRTAGDPVLFLKRQDEGFARYGVPSFQDYDLFADGVSYEERLNYHSLTRLDVRPGGYYAAVYNNQKYMQEEASYTLRARWADSVSLLCPWDCHSHGSCTWILDHPMCVCHDGFGGVFCEGTQQVQVLGQQIHGYVDPGQWSYFSLTLRRNDPSWQGGLAVAFLTTGGGYPVVLQKYSSVPSLINNDRVLRSQQGASGVQTLRLTPDDLRAGTIFFAFFNVDYFVHQRYSFIFLVVPVSPQGSGNDVNAYISLCLGVALSFSAAMSLILLWRWTHHRALEGLPTFGAGRTCTGIEPETVASFPSYRYQEEGRQSVTARAVSVCQTGEAVVEVDEGAVERRKSEPVFSSPNLAAAAAQDPIKVYEGPSCAVCLGDYEMGEMIRQLPDCHHHFHMDCIDQWLATHTTCPMCRRSLLLPDPNAQAPVSPSGSPTAHLLPLWASSARGQQHQELAVELRPLDRQRRTDNTSHDSLEAEGSSTALLNDSTRDVQMGPTIQ